MKIKQKKASRGSKPTGSSKEDKLEAFVDSLDLMTMWESFAHSFNSNGTTKYKTVWSYISSYTKNTKDREVLYWLLGPKVDIGDNERPKFKLVQYDWEEKRKKGFWYSSENIETLTADIHRKASAYESVRQAGKVNVDIIVMLNGLLKQLEDEFGGRLFLPDLSMKENTMRAQLYMGLVEKITTISNQAQLMYARSQGMDLERLDEFYSMFGTAMGKTAATLMGTKQEELGDGKGSHHLQSMFSKVVEMTTSKALEYAMPLPNDLAAAIKEVSDQKVKKAKVN